MNTKLARAAAALCFSLALLAPATAWADASGDSAASGQQAPALATQALHTEDPAPLETPDALAPDAQGGLDADVPEPPLVPGDVLQEGVDTTQPAPELAEGAADTLAGDGAAGADAAQEQSLGQADPAALESPAVPDQELVGQPDGAQGLAVSASSAAGVLRARVHETLGEETLRDAEDADRASEARAMAADAAVSQAGLATLATDGIVEDGTYTISSSLDAGKRLEVQGGSESSAVPVQLWAENATAAQRWKISALEDGTYKIENVKSGLVLDVRGGSTAQKTVVQQYRWNGTNAQRWRLVEGEDGLFTIVSALTPTLALDAMHGSSANGTGAWMYTANLTDAQRWNLTAVSAAVADGFYTITNKNSGKVIDVASGSYDNRANVQQYKVNETQAQTFKFSYNPENGYYTILNARSGKALDVAGGSIEKGANVQQYQPNATLAQYWAIDRFADGTFLIRSAKSGYALDVETASLDNRANIRLWRSNGTGAQKWTFGKVDQWLPEGAYTIMAANNRANVLDVQSASQEAFANITAHKANSTNAQRFYIKPTGDGYYTIQNTYSGLGVSVASARQGANVRQSVYNQEWKIDLASNGLRLALKSNPTLVLDIASGSTASGANVQLYPDNGTIAQRFLLARTDMLADRLYTIAAAANTDLVIGIADGSLDNGATTMVVERDADDGSQKFNIMLAGSGLYRIVNEASGKALQAPGSSGALTQQPIDEQSDAQKWRLSLTESGGILIHSAAYPTMAIDLQDFKLAAGTSVNLFRDTGNDAQKWHVSVAPATPAKQPDPEPAPQPDPQPQKPLTGMTTVVPLNMTLEQMAQWQRDGNPYYADYSIDYIKSYLDPDNASPFQFADLTIFTNSSVSAMDSYIRANGSGGFLMGLGEAFVNAARFTGLNEVYLLAHAILESGWGTSELASGYEYEGGYIDGEYYPAGTYYNFYGIGAVDSSPLSGGRKLAIINGWSNPTLAVTGAARWIADRYIYRENYAQDTLYGMKWDYQYSQQVGTRGWHQYATAVNWPEAIANIMETIFSAVGTTPSVSYIIPEYS